MNTWNFTSGGQRVAAPASSIAKTYRGYEVTTVDGRVLLADLEPTTLCRTPASQGLLLIDLYLRGDGSLAGRVAPVQYWEMPIDTAGKLAIWGPPRPVADYTVGTPLWHSTLLVDTVNRLARRASHAVCGSESGPTIVEWTGDLRALALEALTSEKHRWTETPPPDGESIAAAVRHLTWEALPGLWSELEAASPQVGRLPG